MYNAIAVHGVVSGMHEQRPVWEANIDQAVFFVLDQAFRQNKTHRGEVCIHLQTTAFIVVLSSSSPMPLATRRRGGTSIFPFIGVDNVMKELACLQSSSYMAIVLLC